MTDIDKRIDEIMVELKELEYQATHERSHYYVKSAVRKSAEIIRELQAQVVERDKLLELMAIELRGKCSEVHMCWQEIAKLNGVPDDLPKGETFTDAQGVAWVNSDLDLSTCDSLGKYATINKAGE